MDWIDWTDPCGIKSVAQYSYPVLQSQRHRAFNTTVNYTPLFLVRGNVGSILLLCFLLVGQVADQAKEYGLDVWRLICK